MSALTNFTDATPATIDELLGQLADRAQGLAGLDLEQLLAEASKAEAASEVLRRCKGMADQAERGQRALDAFSLEARRHAGAILAKLSPAPVRVQGAGRGKALGQSERRIAAESAGLERTDASRLVELAQIEDGQIATITEQLEQAGSRLTLSGVLKAAKAPSAVEGYDGDEWYTPPEYLDAARKVFGGAIDCDPASCLVAQRQVRARAWYSKTPQVFDERASAAGITETQAAKLIETWRGLGDVKDGKLTQPLAGAVWCNPPYSIPQPFLSSIIEAYNGGRGLVTAAILLVNVATDTAIQQRLLATSSARCWVAKRIAFLDPTGKPIKGNRYSQVVFYLGPHPTKFAAEFSAFGETKFDNQR
jgi:hypothetical protein